MRDSEMQVKGLGSSNVVKLSYQDENKNRLERWQESAIESVG